MPFEGTRDAIRLKRISHVALGVRDLERQTDFYSRVCGLSPVDRSKRHIYMRAAGTHHHVFELVADHKRVHHLSFQIDDDEDLERCAEILRGEGIQITLGPEREVEPGIGRLLCFLDPEKDEIELVSEVAEFHEDYETKAVRPLSLNHAVLYAGELTKQQRFYERVLGMRVTDTIPRLMSFLRCNPNHHSFGLIALPLRGLQHAAFDLPGRAELSELIVSLGDAGVKRIDGPGRHGPGNMLFVYFEDLDGNLLEWVTEIQQINEETHRPQAWSMQPALNLWQTPEHLGPPKGFRWLLNVLPVISKLRRHGVSSRHQRRAAL